MVTVATSEAAIPTAIAVHTCNDESEAIGLEKYTQRLKRRGEKSERSSRTSVLRTLMELRRGVTTTGLSNERTAPGSAWRSRAVIPRMLAASGPPIAWCRPTIPPESRWMTGEPSKSQRFMYRKLRSNEILFL